MISSVFKLSSNFHALPMSGLQVDSWIRDFPGNGSRCSCGRAAEVNFCFRAAHASNKVPVHCCKGAFTRAKQPSMTANTSAASHHTNGTAGIVKDLNQS